LENEFHALLDRHGILYEGELFGKVGLGFLGELGLAEPGEMLLEVAQVDREPGGGSGRPRREDS
jgi:hypothetical protein